MNTCSFSTWPWPLSETLTRSIGLKAVGVFSPEQFERLDTLHYEVENKLAALISSLEKRRATGAWTGRLAEDSPNDDPSTSIPFAITEDSPPQLHQSINPPIQ